MKAVVLAYMTHVSPSSGVVAQPGINLRAVCAQLLNAFWLTPVADEARAWGAFPFETDQTCAHSLPLATGFTAADVLRVGLTGRYKSHAASWLEASLALTRPSIRFLLLFVWSARRVCLDLIRLVRGRLSAGEFARRNRRLVRGFVQSRRRLWHPATIEAAV